MILSLVVGGALIAAHQLGEVQQEAFGALTDSTGLSGPPASSTRSARSQHATNPRSGWKRVLDYADHRIGIALVGAGALGLGYSLARRLRRRPAPERPLAPEPQPHPTALQPSVFEKRQLILRILSKEKRLSADRIQIRHVMTHEAVHVGPRATLSEVRELMHDKKLRHLLVCDSRGGLLGVVSDRDLIGRRGKTAADLMTHHPVTVTPESLIVPSITWMINQHISCLPVVSENRVVGVVTTTDLLLTLQCSLQLLEHWQDESDQEAAGQPDAIVAC